MKIRRMSAAVAVAATGALLFSACSSPASNDDDDNASETTPSAAEIDESDPCKQDSGVTETQDGNVSYSVGEDEFLGYNTFTPETYSTYNSVVTERILGAFTYFGTDGTICQDESFGTYEVTSEDPLQVTYTIADDAVWSDGTPVTNADFILDWAAQAIPTEDDEATPLFNHVSGLTYGEYVPDGPQGDPDGKEFVLDYPVVYADWEILVAAPMPAHVAAEQAGMTTEEMATAIRDRDYTALEPLAEFWNTGWLSPTPGELPDPALVPSSGPYAFKENGWTAGQSLTLTANEEFWGTPAATKEMTFRFTAADTHVQALQNGDLDVIQPQATVDTLGQLEAIGESVTVLTGPTLTWEHLDYNFREGNVFADSLELREAFAMCVPRQKIVDNLITPIDPEAVVMNAREVFPFQDNYDEVVEASYDGRYDEVDIDGAKAKIEEAGVDTPVTVRIGYSAPNPRRSDEVALIKSSCDEAGFEIQDVGSEDFFDKTLPNGDYEIALFAWAGSGQKASGQNIYATGQPQNYGEYSDATVDEAWDTLASTIDESVQLEQVKVIEKGLWDTLYGIPLFAHPGVVGYNTNLQNVRDTATQSQVVWNSEQWYRAS
ncbi:ABC transporter family substrate-binding protein [Cellulosimicrobium arenosum]|uniref:ABC transporter family substrate-binding protein n=1 Tax=Cellulosimicrobium arenosum TaxID=2708133 RepID=A0A927G7T5_9MICO|nr:ABC transporter family substrate-binding protein [Cellulosimicrobium arenosum]MBD8078139.1 ABC transporter family substrate-binding protein [Cellulosimicrobium arenosum]